MKPTLSSFSAILIVGGIFYIVFLLYYIGSEIINVQSTNTIIEKREAEVTALEKKRNEKLQTKYIMLSPQYQDRIAKENKQFLNDGEEVFILPEPSVSANEENQTSEYNEKEIQKPIREQWADVFFGTKE